MLRKPHKLTIAEQGTSPGNTKVKIRVEPEQIEKVIEKSLSSHEEYVKDRLVKSMVDTADSELTKGKNHLDRSALEEAIKHEADDMVEETYKGFEAGVKGADAGGAGKEEAIELGGDEADEIVWTQSASEVRAERMREAAQNDAAVERMLERTMERMMEPGLPESGLDDLQDFEDQMNRPGTPERGLEDLEEFAREIRQQQLESHTEANEEQAQHNHEIELENFLADANSDAEFRAHSEHGFHERAPSQAPEIQSSSPNALESLAHEPFMQHEARRSTDAINTLHEKTFGESLSEAERDMLTEVQTQDLTSDSLENNVATSAISKAERLGSLVEGRIRQAMSEDTYFDKPTSSVQDLLVRSESMLRAAQQQLGRDYETAYQVAVAEGASSEEVMSVVRDVMQEIQLAEQEALAEEMLAENTGRGKQYYLDMLKSIQDFSDVEPMQRAIEDIRADLLAHPQNSATEINEPNSYLRYRAQLRDGDTFSAASRDRIQRLRATDLWQREQDNSPDIYIKGPANALNAKDPAPTLGMSPADRLHYLKQTHAFWYEYPADFMYTEAIDSIQREYNARMTAVGMKVSDARLIHKLKGQLQQMDAYKKWCREVNMDSRAYPPTLEQLHDVAQKYFNKFGRLTGEFKTVEQAERYLTQPWRSTGGPRSRPGKL